jgi:uncharacterized membrane protein YdjX (TVP38/TMEM64 family)
MGSQHDFLLQLALGWKESGLLGWAALASTFVLASCIIIPRTVICVIGGFVFGFAAVPIAVIGSTAGSVLAFLLSRYICRTFFLVRLQRWPAGKAVLNAAGAQGWKIVGLLRLASPIPGTVTNYLFGVTGIGIWPYTFATLVGLIPQSFLFVYVGVVGQMAMQESPLESTVRTALFAVGLLCTTAAVLLVVRGARAALTHSVT